MMSWEGEVRAALLDLNPLLRDELIRTHEIDGYVSDLATRTKESYEIATANVTNPNKRWTAREVAVAQMREEIEPAPQMQPILP